MTVGELINILNKFDHDLPVCTNTKKYSWPVYKYIKKPTIKYLYNHYGYYDDENKDEENVEKQPIVII